MITVKQLLPELRANRNTYNNLDNDYISDFKTHYNYLKSHGDVEVTDFVYRLYISMMGRNCNKPDYTKKYQGLVFLSTNLCFKN